MKTILQKTVLIAKDIERTSLACCPIAESQDRMNGPEDTESSYFYMYELWKRWNNISNYLLSMKFNKRCMCAFDSIGYGKFLAYSLSRSNWGSSDSMKSGESLFAYSTFGYSSIIMSTGVGGSAMAK
jgi:hypothetical protein